MAGKVATKSPKKAKPSKDGVIKEKFRERKKVEYNIQKLSDQSVFVPKPEIKKKVVPAKGKKVKKTSGTYEALIKRALKDVDGFGLGLQSIVNFIEGNYPDKTSRRHVRMALQTGVANKVFVQHRGSYRLSKKAAKKRSTKKKAATEKSSTKKTTKKVAKKTTGKTTKKTTGKTTKKTTGKTTGKSTKKTTGKKSNKEEAPKSKKSTTKRSAVKKTTKRAAADSDSEPTVAKSPKKKTAIGPPASDEGGPVLEAAGNWMYWDGGWQNYAEDASRIVEGVFQEYNTDTTLHVRPVQSGHFSYSVDFHKLEQTNTSTGTVRKIRRV